MIPQQNRLMKILRLFWGVRGLGLLPPCSLIENQLTRSTSSYLPYTLWQVLIRGAEAAAEYQTFIVFTPKELRY